MYSSMSEVFIPLLLVAVSCLVAFRVDVLAKGNDFVSYFMNVCLQGSLATTNVWNLTWPSNI